MEQRSHASVELALGYHIASSIRRKASTAIEKRYDNARVFHAFLAICHTRIS